MVNAKLLQKYRAHFPEQYSESLSLNGFDFSDLTSESSLEDLISTTIKIVDTMKTKEHHPHLGGIIHSSDYKKIQQEASVPQRGQPFPQVMIKLQDLASGHPIQTEFYMTNAIPLPTKFSLAAHLLGAYLNSNPVFDVYGPAAADAETEAIAMMAEILGYDKLKAGGYFTSGGSAGNKAALRIGVQKAAITKLNPDEIHLSERTDFRKVGAPDNLYVFSNELAHFSVDEVMASANLGSDHNIKVKSNLDNSMNIDDLEKQMREVLKPKSEGGKGGLIAAIYATVGTTDSFGMDEVSKIKEIRDRLVEEFNLPYNPHLHADMANGGLFTMFNDYNFEENPLGIDDVAVTALQQISKRMQQAKEADSAIFDFHKLGYSPYLNSLFVVKDAGDQKLVDRDEDCSPYIGERSYSHHHTGYTEECSRISASLPALVNLKTLGKEGYQVILANLIERAEQLKSELDDQNGVKVLNKEFPGPIVNLMNKWKRNLKANFLLKKLKIEMHTLAKL